MSPTKGKEIKMNSILLTAWAALIVCFVALLIYRGQLARYEDEQLFLNDEVTYEQQFQQTLVRRLQRIEPVVSLVGGAAAVATVCGVGIYVWGVWQQLQS
jgi:cytochrome c-type biogenesis protein CcmH/NrfG